MNKKPILYFFTSAYPYGTGETFIENEIELLSRQFEQVLIIPGRLAKDEKHRAIPANAKVMEVASLVSEMSFSERIKFGQFIVNELVKHPIVTETYRYRLAYFKQLFSRYINLKRYLKANEKENAVFYTFWFEDWATVLGLLKREKTILSFVSRAHGYDIYEERRADGFIPFRNLQLKWVDKIYCASKASMNYLHKRYPQFKTKILYAYLGVNDRGINPVSESDIFTIVSVSNIIPIKRVELVAEILSFLKIKIRWIHFGDGEGEKELRYKISTLPKNIKAVLMGRLSNQEVLDFYKTNSVDLIINVSETEGLPVSIMEAISFGIPAIATNAGGTSEIINQQTGVLLDIDFDPAKAAKKIELILMENARKESFRMGIKEFWKENFDAEKNYTGFVKRIKKS